MEFLAYLDRAHALELFLRDFMQRMSHNMLRLKFIAYIHTNDCILLSMPTKRPWMN